LTSTNPQNGPPPLLGDAGGEELLESGTVSSGIVNPIPDLKTSLSSGLGGKRKVEEDPKDAQERAQQEYKRRLMAASLHDRTKAFNPDYVTPFSSRNDMYARLLCFHVFQATSPQLKPEEDWKAECESKTRDIASKVDKLRAQWDKLVSTSRPGPTYVPREEKILLDKLSYFDEKFEFEAIKTRLGLKPAAAAAAQPYRQVSGTVTNPIPHPSSQGLSVPRPQPSVPGLVRTPTPAVLPSSPPTTVIPVPISSSPSPVQSAVVIPPPVMPLPVAMQSAGGAPYSSYPQQPPQHHYPTS
jgi:hypothetical protein